MQFFFLNVDETLIGIQNSAQVCKVDEAKYTASFAFEETADFSFDDVYYVGFHDIDNNLVFYEVRDMQHSSTANGVVTIDAEHAAFAELIDEVVEGKSVQGATAGYATGYILEGSRWHVGSAETTPTMSTTFYFKNKWECFETIAKATGCAFYFRWTITGNAVTDRQVIIKARPGAARGKRFDLSKDLTSITVVEDRSSVYTKLYGRGKGEEVGTGQSGQATYGRRIDFGDVVWSVAHGDPMNKPSGQKYLEDVSATQSLGRGPSSAKRAREGVITFEACEDPEELLQLTYEKLLTVRYPKLTITGKVIDLERVWGYQHEAVRMGDDVLVIADKWSASYQDKIVGIVRDYLNPFNTDVTIGEEGHTSYSLTSKLSSEIEAVKEKADIGSALAVANPNLLQGILDTMATRIISSGTGISTDPNDGSLVLTANDGSSAVKITGSGILISNTKIAGAWQWRTALDGDGVATGTLTAGVINAAIIRILGTDQFYWDASNIYIKNPDDIDQQIRIGCYDGTNYGIAFTMDGGQTWQNAIDFSGVKFSSSSVIETVLDSDAYKDAMDGKADKTSLDEVEKKADKAVTSVDVMYYLSTSTTNLSGGTWSTVAPEWTANKYMWSKTVTQYADGTSEESAPTCIAGAAGKDGKDGKDGINGVNGVNGINGSDGRGITTLVEEYYLSLSATALTGGSWSTTAPTWEAGKYIWTRTAIYYTDSNTPSYTAPICTTGAKGQDGADGSNGNDGVSTYTHIRYSANANGSGMTTAPSDSTLYIGICVTQVSVAPTSSSQYVWSRYVGKDGADGKNGTNGKDGTSVTILGSYDTYEALVAAHPTGSTGDSYIIDGNLYVWASGQWKNVGSIQGPAGADGKDGKDGANGQNGADGKNGTSAYIHIRYSASSNGSGMVAAPTSSTKYIGICISTSGTAPTSAASYTWSKYVGEDGANGKDGANGVGISSVVPYYCIGSSETTAPSTPTTTGWSVVAPAVEYGSFLWCSYLIRFTDSTQNFTTPFKLNGADQLTQSASAPSNPVEGMLWLDTSSTPYELKRYTESTWEIVSDYSGQISSVYAYVDTSVAEVKKTTSEISAYVEDKTVAKSTYDEFTEIVRNILSMDADGTTMIFQRISEAISSVDNKQQTNYNEILKYIRFVGGNIILGEEGNEITLTIQNDRLSFQQNGNEIAYLSDNNLIIANAEIKAGGRLRLGAFGFVPRADGSLSFLKVGEGN